MTKTKEITKAQALEMALEIAKKVPVQEQTALRKARGGELDPDRQGFRRPDVDLHRGRQPSCPALLLRQLQVPPSHPR